MIVRTLFTFSKGNRRTKKPTTGKCEATTARVLHDEQECINTAGKIWQKIVKIIEGSRSARALFGSRARILLASRMFEIKSAAG